MTLRPPPRDTRIDLLRGWLQMQIFASHAHGSLIGAWLITAAWGLSDSSEQFVYLSGFALGSVFTLKAARGGWKAALRDLLLRIRRLWTTHMIVLCAMAAMVIAVDMAVPVPGEARRLGWGWLLDAPWLALPGGAVLLWQPEEMGILPVFIACMVLLPGFLWLVARVGAGALLPPLALYVAVQAWGWHLPGLAGREIEFNPLAWQFLFLLGAWFGQRALRHGRAIGWHPLLFTAAILALAAGVVLRLAGGDLGFLTAKQNLGPARLLHGLALAYATVMLWQMREMRLRGWAAHALAAAGRHSLQVFCVGLFLSYGLTLLFRRFGWMPWLEGLVICGGLTLLLFASRTAAQPTAPRAPEPAQD